jgi:hypothetical protein
LDAAEESGIEIRCVHGAIAISRSRVSRIHTRRVAV